MGKVDIVTGRGQHDANVMVVGEGHGVGEGSRYKWFEMEGRNAY